MLDIKNLEICPSFRDFTFTGWVPENDPRPTLDLPPPAPPQQLLSDLNDDHVFDMNQTPEPIPDVDFVGGGGGGFDGRVIIFYCDECILTGMKSAKFIIDLVSIFPFQGLIQMRKNFMQLPIHLIEQQLSLEDSQHML